MVKIRQIPGNIFNAKRLKILLAPETDWPYHVKMPRAPSILPARIEDQEPAPEITLPDLWDEKIPNSFINLLPRRISERFKDKRFENPELFDLPEDDLRQIFRSRARRISVTENQLRLRLWYEFELCQGRDDTRINLSRLIAGLCTVTTFHQLLTKAEAVAWLACPPLSYETHLDELINFGAARMREAMTYDPKDPTTGKVDAKLLKIQHDIYQAAELRKMGAVAQVTKNMHIHAKAGAQHVENRTEEAMQKKIDELRLRQKNALNPPKPPSPNGGLPILGPEDV